MSTTVDKGQTGRDIWVDDRLNCLYTGTLIYRYPYRRAAVSRNTVNNYSGN